MALKTNADKIKAGYIDACNAILARGGYVPNGMPIGELDEAIKGIPRDQVLAYYKQVNSEQVITVPHNAEPYARMGKIGGMTYKSENLIPFPYRKPAGYTETSAGVTYTVQEDGGISVVGTSTGDATFVLQGESNPSFVRSFVAGKTYTISGGKGYVVVNARTMIEGGSTYSWIESNTNKPEAKTGVFPEGRILQFVDLYVANGRTVNEVVYPMLNEGTTAKPYSQFFKGLRNAAVSEMKSDGANLIPPPTRNWTSNGITFTVQDDGSIIANGTATGEATYELIKNGLADNIKLTKGETYTFSGCPANGSNTTYRMVMQHTGYSQNFDDFGSGVTKVTSYEDYYVFIRIYAGYTANNLVFKPTLNKGTTALPYSTFGTLDTLPVPTEIQALDGYGGGVSGYPNYIDYERKVFVQNTYYKVCDGKEPWGAYSTNTEGKYRILLATPNIPAPVKVDGAYISPIICNHYDTITGNKVYTCNRGCNCTGTFVAFYDEAYNTNDISLWKAHLAELYANGNPLVIEYALGTPIEIDISAYLTDEFVKVESDGTLTAVNEHNYDMPTEVNYIINTVGG